MISTMSAGNDPCRPELKVTVLLHGYEIFGVRRFLLNQLAQARQYGIDFEYVCLGPGAFYEELRGEGAKVSLLGVPMPFDRAERGNPFTWLLRRGRFWTAICAIRRHLMSRRPHIVYSHAYYTHMLCSVAAKRTGSRAIGQIHGLLNPRRFMGLQRALVCVMCAWALDGIFTISEATYGSTWGPARRKASVIYNGVDIEAIRGSVEGISKQEGHMVLVGRIAGGKQQDVAIRSVRMLADEGVECVLHIVGGPVDESNPYYRRLRDLVHELGLGDRVRFRGVISPPYQLVAGCDVCIHCSTHEAFGLVIVEAMACGTAVVVAHGGGPAELIEDGRTGLYFEPGNPTSLAKALKRVLADANLRSRLAEAAYQDARRKFDMSVHMRSFRAELLKYCPTIND